MKNNLYACLIALTILAGSSSASLIIGDIGFVGTLNTVPAGGLAGATGIDIINDTGTVNISTGTFAAGGVSVNDVASFVDFSFSPFAAVTPLWSVGAYSFDLTSLNVDFQSANALVLSGKGTVMSTHVGEDDTPGFFTFSANSGGSSFNFSSITTTPEPVSLMVWGGLAAVGVSVRRRR